MHAWICVLVVYGRAAYLYGCICVGVGVCVVGCMCESMHVMDLCACFQCSSCRSACLCVCICVCVCVCVCICVCVCEYTCKGFKRWECGCLPLMFAVLLMCCCCVAAVLLLCCCCVAAHENTPGRICMYDYRYLYVCI